MRSGAKLSSLLGHQIRANLKYKSCILLARRTCASLHQFFAEDSRCQACWASLGLIPSSSKQQFTGCFLLKKEQQRHRKKEEHLEAELSGMLYDSPSC